MAEFRTLELAKAYYYQGKQQQLPQHLKDQFLRSSSSIALNLSEGNAKSSRRDRLRIFEIAYGSFREAQTILDLAEVNDSAPLATWRFGVHRMVYSNQFCRSDHPVAISEENLKI